MRQLIMLAILIFVAIKPLLAQTSQSVKQGNFVIQTYMDTCARHSGKNAEVSSYAKENKFARADTGFSKAVLQGDDGEVWGVPNAIGHFIVVLTGEKQCAVWARAADAKTAKDGFEKLVKNLSRPGLTVKPRVDRVLDGAGGQYKQLGYFVQKDGASSGLLMLLTTSESPAAEIQVRLSAAISKP